MNRALALGLLVVVAAAALLWRLAGEGGQPALPSAPGATANAADAGAARGPVVAPDAPPAAAVPATAAVTEERAAVAAAAAGDEKRPALTGQVVGPEGLPVAGAVVHAAPGFGFANATGEMDFDTFDFGDFDELEDFDPTTMMDEVRAQLAARVMATTDAQGRFRLHPPGESRGVGLRVLARGHAILDRRVERPVAKDVDIGTLALKRGAVVAGRVLDPNGTPIAGAQVSRVNEMEARMLGGLDVEMPGMGEVETLRGGEAATTDADGRFELAHIAAGEFALRARHPDHPTARSASLQVETGREVRDVLVTMQRGGEIRGTVSGLPAQWKDLQVMAAKKPRPEAADPTGMLGGMGGMFGDVTEMLSEMGMGLGERTATIAADGAFVLRGLSRDTYRVWVARTGAGFAGNTTCSARVEAMPGGNVELRFEPGVSVTFRVVASGTGTPIERLWVREQLRGGDGFAAMMAAGMPQQRRQGHYPDGAVTVANLRPKTGQKLTLTVEAVGHSRFERSDIELPKDGNLDLGTIELAVEPTLEVAVTADGRPVAGAAVRLVEPDDQGDDNPFAAFAGRANGGGPAQARTDRHGKCRINRIANGTRCVVVTAKGCAPYRSEPLEFGRDGPNEFAATMLVGGSVEVRVADLADKPVVGAVVERRGETATKKTDAQGVVRFDHLAPGPHEFRLGEAGGAMAAMMMRMRERGEQAAEAGWQSVAVADKATATLRLTKQPTATLRGFVRENGVPLAGARVTFREGPGAADEREGPEAMFGGMMENFGGGNTGPRNGKTDDQGAYQLKELPEGEHRLQITHKGRAMPARAAIVLRNGENVFDVELDMTTVRGVVLDPAGKPVDGARVRVRRPSGDGEREQVGEAVEGMMSGLNLGGGSSLKTDAAGVFELRGVDPDAELVVSATAKGFAPGSVKVTATRGTTTAAPELRLLAAGKVKVTVAGDATFGAVTARFVGEGDPVPPVMQMLRRGKGTLDGLRPGTWEIEVQGMRREGEAEKKRTVEVVAGQTLELEM